jgi:hypothetical protein
MRHLPLLLSFLLSDPCCGSVLFTSDYNIAGFGATDAEIFSTDFSVGAVSVITSLEVELSNSYVGELVLTLRSPTGDTFSTLDNDGLRTRVGAGDSLLNGVELYTFIDPAKAKLSVVDWSFTRYQPGGTYGAREWATGSWESGTWNLTLFNDDIASVASGVVGTVRLNGEPVPEPSGVMLFALGSGLALLARRRPSKVESDSP